MGVIILNYGILRILVVFEGLDRAQKRQAVLLTSSDDQKMQKKKQDLKKIFEKKEELDFKNCIW